MATILKSFGEFTDEMKDKLPPDPEPSDTTKDMVQVALMFKKKEEEKIVGGRTTVSFDGTKSRSGILMVKCNGKYIASAVEYKGIYWDKGGKLVGPMLRTVGMYKVQCPKCGTVACTGSDLIKAAHRAGIDAKTAKDALKLHRVCPNCKMERITGWGYLDISGGEGDEVYGAENVEALKKACDEAKAPFVIPPVVALLPDPCMLGSREDEIPGEFPELVSALMDRAINYSDDKGDYPMRLCDISEYKRDVDPDVCGWQLVMPELYSGVASFEAIDGGIRSKSGPYKVELQVFLQDAAGIKEKRHKEAFERESSKRRKPPRVAGL